mgnify:CR=1 FL=1
MAFPTLSTAVQRSDPAFRANAELDLAGGFGRQFDDHQSAGQQDDGDSHGVL